MVFYFQLVIFLFRAIKQENVNETTHNHDKLVKI